MSDKMSQSNDQPPSQHGSQDNRPDAPDLLFRPPLPTDYVWLSKGISLSIRTSTSTRAWATSWASIWSS